MILIYNIYIVSNNYVHFKMFELFIRELERLTSQGAYTIQPNLTHNLYLRKTNLHHNIR